MSGPGFGLHRKNTQGVDIVGAQSHIFHVSVKPSLPAFQPGGEGGLRLSGSSHVNKGTHTVKCSMCVKHACLHTNGVR